MEEQESPYLKRVREDFERSKKRIESAKARIKSPAISDPEKIYGKIGEAVKDSTVGRNTTFNRGGSGLPKARTSPSPEWTEVLETIPVDADRSIEIRTNPAWPDNFEYAATKQMEVHPKRYSWDTNLDFPPPVPHKQKKDIASISVNPKGHVSMVTSSARGAGEGAVERIMMEAAKRDMTPHSTTQLGPGQNMVNRFVKEYKELPKEKYLQKIKDFLTTGKTGKIWSTVGPYLGPVGTAATVAGGLGYSDIAGAATDALVPGGIEEMGVSPEQAELDRRYAERVRQLSKKGK